MKARFRLTSRGSRVFVWAFFLTLFCGFVTACWAGPLEPAMGLGELNRLLKKHPLKPAPENIQDLDVFTQTVDLGEGALGATVFSIPGFKALGCAGCHAGEALVAKASESMRRTLKRLHLEKPGLAPVPLRQYILQPWTDGLLKPGQFAHTTFDAIRLFPQTVLIDDAVYQQATHLHEALHLTQRFLGMANELEAYGLNILADPRFLLLNYPYFSDVVRAFFMPEFDSILERFFSRPINEGLEVPREVQWFVAAGEEENLAPLEEAVKKLQPLLKEASRLNREQPLEAAYLSERTGVSSLLLDIAAAKTLPPAHLNVTEDVRVEAFRILKEQFDKNDNTRLGYRVDRRKESLLHLQHRLKLAHLKDRYGLYFLFLRQRFTGPEGHVRLTIDDQEDFERFVSQKLKQVQKLKDFKGMTPMERQSAERFSAGIKKELSAMGR